MNNKKKKEQAAHFCLPFFLHPFLGSRGKGRQAAVLYKIKKFKSLVSSAQLEPLQETEDGSLGAEM